MPFTSGDIIVRRYDDRHWELVQQLVYTGQKDRFVVPYGFVTDFASVPRPVVWLIPRFGRYTAAAILHDYLLISGQVTPRDADGLFRRVLREEGVSALRRWLMWAGVRWGALANRDRRAGWWRDAPAVLGISLLAAPLVVPPALAVTGALLLYGLAELLAGKR